MSRRPFASALIPAILLAWAPGAHAGDSRLVTHGYNAEEVVRVDGQLGVQATIAFGENELIENVAVGDSAKWQITPNKRADVLFIKPLAASARTNMTVLTDKRTYLFDLVASPAARPVYMLRFAYKDEAPKAQGGGGPAAALLSEAESAAIAAEPGTVPVDPATLNFAWRGQGAEKLLPLRIYDDGNAAYLQLGEKQAVPAILVRNEKGEEGPVNFAVRGDTIVIDQVPGLIVLRSGKSVATLHNTRKIDAPKAAAPAAVQPPSVALSALPQPRN